MSWRDQLQQGKFRNVEFFIDSADLNFGRRVKVHEYPGRDKPYAEDLGRQAREFTIDCYVLGPDYFAQRDAMIAAIEQPGSGTLVHPYLGIMKVTITKARKRESTQDGGLCRFTLTCVESGALTFPTSKHQTPSDVSDAADDVETAAADDFVATYNVTGQPQSFVDILQSNVSDIMSSVENTVSGVTAPIASAIRAPYNMASNIIGGLNEVRTALTEPLRALGLYRGLFDIGGTLSSTGTASRRILATNQQAVQQLTRRAALAEAARASADATYATSSEALATRDTLLDAIDAQALYVNQITGAPIDDAVYYSLAALRAAVAKALTERGASLPSLAYYEPPATMPALLAAYLIYGDASRVDELVARNPVNNPGFMAGGVPLEYLDAT